MCIIAVWRTQRIDAQWRQALERDTPIGTMGTSISEGGMDMRTQTGLP